MSNTPTPNVIQTTKTHALNAMKIVVTANGLLKFKPIKPTVSVKKSQTKFDFEIASDAKTIYEIQCFRAKIFSEAYGVYFENKRDSDPYDQYSLHAIVRDRATGQIAAYTRIITPQAKAKLGKYYSESEFDLGGFLQQKKGVYELGRTCVDMPYRSSKALPKLWVGMADLLIMKLKAQYLIGCVSVNVDPSQQRIMATEYYVRKKAKVVAINSYKKLPVAITANVKPHKYKQKVPSLIKKYCQIGATFSAQGYYDQAFNCVDYFSCIKVNRSLVLKLSLVCKVIELKVKLKASAKQ